MGHDSQQVQQQGEVYLLGNVAMPCMYKIGHTKRSVEARILELSRSTSVPRAFYLVVALKTYHPRLVELQVHSRLHAYRANASREFFEFPDDREAAIAFLTQVVDSGVYEPVTIRPPVTVSPEPAAPLPELTEEEREIRQEKAIAAIRGLRDIVAGRAQL